MISSKIFLKTYSNTLRLIGTILLIFTLAMPTFSFGASRADAASSYKIVGYYPAWAAYGRNYNVTDIDPNKVTHINYAFADICWNGIHGNPDPTGPNPVTWSCQNENSQTINVPNGTIVLGDPWIDTGKRFAGDTWDQPYAGNINQLNKLKTINPNLKTIISVGGWTWSNRFSDVAASQTTRETFANSAVDFLRKFKFDGIDLDWEYPVSGGLAGNSYRAADKQNYTLLLQEIRNKLNAAESTDGKHYLLTIASGASPSYAQNTELNKIAGIVDWINIMTYDFNGGWQAVSAHNAPLYFDPAAGSAGVPDAASFNVDAAVQGHLNSGVPASKLVMGVPFYGRGWDGVGSANNGQYQTGTGASQVGTWEAGVFDFSDLEANYINKNGYTRYWNDTAKVPYLYNASNRRYISYDDTESVGNKTAYIKSKGLAGAMFWELSSDRNKTLLTKVNTDLGGGTPPPADTAPPSAPANLVSTGKTSNSVSLSWNASTDNVGVTSYLVYNGSTLAATVSGTSGTVSGLSASTTYTFTVKASDAAGNVSGSSNAVTVTTNAPQQDTTAPSAPTNLSVTSKTSTSVTLSWTASTDNVGVTGYDIYNGSVLAASVTGTSATISGLTASTSYTFTVKAKDAAGNISGASNAVTVTTDASGSTIQEWQPNTWYSVGQLVTYNGLTYKCIQAHTSLVGWEPPIVPALWGLQ
ncbi:glycosyl hydrolase family 18 protein [Paenibacillus sediminis]|uniref:chitinase n=1 Tax=Paenibacillus sediminis TaxID=664909 RepID=A0ABS4H1B8_9BACL|nr:glycosyl hydrolase family 18 protein [Paenibacillus sediminis]MBP1936305.1 chitinase [Paenibacillus sediminis]